MKKFFLLLLIVSLLIVPLSLSLSADTVTLKNGMKYENVQARITSGELRIESPDGHTVAYPIELLRDIQYAPLQGKGNPVAGDKSNVNPKAECEIGTVLALLPVASAHFCHDRYMAGAFFSAAKLLS